MARYKPYNLKQDKRTPLSYADQIVPGSFEYALNEIVEEHLDLSVFEARYRNDETGRLAYDPKVLLKIVLYGYPKWMVSSRKLEAACRRNVVFMALSADTRPHFTTIAAATAAAHAARHCGDEAEDRHPVGAGDLRPSDRHGGAGIRESSEQGHASLHVAWPAQGERAMEAVHAGAQHREDRPRPGRMMSGQGARGRPFSRGRPPEPTAPGDPHA
jgi:hypothetical protein